MILFAVDSATSAAGAAVWRDGKILAESFADVGLTHSRTLMVLVDEVFRRAGLAPGDVDYYAVTDGPGSFTGLRIGMGIVKGLAYGAGKLCVAVSALETLAWNVAGVSRRAVAVCDARRGRVYHAAFDAENGVRRLCEDGVVEMEALAELYKNVPIILVGDAAQVCYNMLCTGVDCVLPAPGSRMPRASSVAAAAAAIAEAGGAVAAGDLAPRYIQLPQAERERKQKEREKHDSDSQ